MDRLHKALDRMCDKKGLDTRDHLHRALDAVLARKAKLGGTPTTDAKKSQEVVKPTYKPAYKGGAGGTVTLEGLQSLTLSELKRFVELHVTGAAIGPAATPSELALMKQVLKNRLEQGRDAATDLIKPPSIVMDAEGRCVLRPVGNDSVETRRAGETKPQYERRLQQVDRQRTELQRILDKPMDAWTDRDHSRVNELAGLLEYGKADRWWE